ncbi:PaaX family transcriptional regulator C-terminal domain-containing protein [Egicoccus sp. AB-alg2]|uniref:PaaX family transcriptional regulator n=1 Tax=Egicoccus sp. AB-alg2 TaxID=3242693 RepID=UPI00359E248A
MTDVGIRADRKEALRQYAAEGLRPQTLLFTMLGHHVAGRDLAVASGTFIAALEQLGVSTQAARSTLARMVRRGHLRRHRVGRKAYFTLTGRLMTVLEEGANRLFAPPVRVQPENVWTLLSFSIPEDQRAFRHNLRTALAWSGFGLLRNGLWIAPGDVDATGMLDTLDLHEHVEVFVARPAPPTDLHRIVGEAWDLGVIAQEYRDFLLRWGGDDWRAGTTALAAQVRLLTEWQQILVDDPELPVTYLPADWPALRAYELFRQRLEEIGDDAAAGFAEILDALPPAELPAPESAS